MGGELWWYWDEGPQTKRRYFRTIPPTVRPVILEQLGAPAAASSHSADEVRRVIARARALLCMSPSETTAADARRAYRRRMFEAHPDRPDRIGDLTPELARALSLSLKLLEEKLPPGPSAR
jgi:hypothetical protein